VLKKALYHSNSDFVGAYWNEVIKYWNKTEQNSTTNLKEEKSVEEKLYEYLKENEIEVDEHGNFEMYVVVDVDDKDHEIGSIFHGEKTEAYTEKRAYDDLKENNYGKIYAGMITSGTITYSNIYYNPVTKISKNTSIKEDLLTIKDKIFKVLVNEENVTNVKNDIVYVNKYKVIESVDLRSELKFKISSINEEKVVVLLYNSLTEKSKTITVEAYAPISLSDVKSAIEMYLQDDENNVALMNSLVDDGAVL